MQSTLLLAKWQLQNKNFRASKAHVRCSFLHMKDGKLCPAVNVLYLEVGGADDLLVLAEPLDDGRRVSDDAALEASLLALSGVQVLEQLRELGRHHLGRDARRRDVAHLAQSCKQRESIHTTRQQTCVSSQRPKW